MMRERRAFPLSIGFVYALVWLLAALDVFALFLSWVSLSIDKPLGPSAEHLLMGAHAALFGLLLTAGVGMNFRRRWGARAALAAFGLFAALGLLFLYLVLWPGPLLGGQVDRDWWPLAAVYLVCASPGALLLRRWKAYPDVKP